MTCGFQSGASYHISPMRMSFLPSLSTSATATPSERNFESRTMRCQTILVRFAVDLPADLAGVLSWAEAVVARSKPRRPTSGRCRMGVHSCGGNVRVDYRDVG